MKVDMFLLSTVSMGTFLSQIYFLAGRALKKKRYFEMYSISNSITSYIRGKLYPYHREAHLQCTLINSSNAACSANEL